MKRAILAAVMVMAVGAMAQDDAGPVPQTEIGVDLLAVREDGGIVKHVKANWGKYLLGIAAGYAVDQAADKNGWLWHRDEGAGDGPQNTAPQTDNDEMGVTVTGNGNTVIVEQTIVIESGAVP